MVTKVSDGFSHHTYNRSRRLAVVIVTFIVRVYAPTWFSIKQKSSCKDGARHLFMMIKNSRYQTDKLKAIVDPVIQRNRYFAHPKNTRTITHRYVYMVPANDASSKITLGLIDAQPCRVGVEETCRTEDDQQSGEHLPTSK